MGNIISINTVEVVALVGMVAAYFLGKQQGRPRGTWPKGNLLDGGYEAWRLPLVITVMAAAFVVLFGRLLTSLFDSVFHRGYGGMSGGGMDMAAMG